MNFVLIVEPDEVNLARIRAILEGIETDFEYALADSAESGIDAMEKRMPDVFIGDMEMPVVSGAEFFGLVEMMSPETVRIVMTEAHKIAETVAFMNECRTFKVIIKPCRLAEDLLEPIEAAFAYRALNQRMLQETEAGEQGFASGKQGYERLQESYRSALKEHEQATALFSAMLRGNLALGNRPAPMQARLAEWYRWMLEQYGAQIVVGGRGYQESVKELMTSCHVPSERCTVQIRRNPSCKPGTEQMCCLIFLMTILMRLCRELLLQYEITVIIDTARDAEVLKFSCVVKDEGDGIPYREKNGALRAEMIRALGKMVMAFGDRVKILPRENKYVLNLAVRRRES